MKEVNHDCEPARKATGQALLRLHCLESSQQASRRPMEMAADEHPSPNLERLRLRLRDDVTSSERGTVPPTNQHQGWHQNASLPLPAALSSASSMLSLGFRNQHHWGVQRASSAAARFRATTLTHGLTTTQRPQVKSDVFSGACEDFSPPGRQSRIRFTSGSLRPLVKHSIDERDPKAVS